MTDWRLSIFGVITLFVVYYLQDGIVGFVRNALNLQKRVATPPSGAVAKLRSTRSRPPRRRALRATSSNAGKVLMQFGGLKALNNVDLVVKRGAIHGLIGPNGSGKSTMMNVLTGIYQPTAGTVVVRGQDRWSGAPRPTSLSRASRAPSRTSSCSAR